MNIRSIVPASYLLSTALSILGGYFKITHSAAADTWLTIALVALVLFVVTAVYEMRSSTRFSFAEKTLWTVGFILFPPFVGLLYLLIGRRRLVRYS